MTRALRQGGELRVPDRTVERETVEQDQDVASSGIVVRQAHAVDRFLHPAAFTPPGHQARSVSGSKSSVGVMGRRLSGGMTV